MGDNVKKAGRALFLSAATALQAGCGSVGAQPPVQLGELTPVEAAYVAQTGAVIYRRASVEQLSGLLFSDERGHATCVRSPAGAGDAADYTLLILQRRIVDDFISQAADDVLILRSAADAAPCRELARASHLWVRAH